MPDYYGTGRPPVKRSRAPLIVALVLILLGTNLITAGYFLGLGSRQAIQREQNSLPSQESAPSDIRETPISDLSSGLAEITAGQKEGTGIILSADGYILTNAALAEGQESLSVTLSDGASYTAVPIGLDLESDIAVIKISAQGLSPAPYALSDKVAAGDVLSLFPFRGTELTEILVQDTQRFWGGLQRRFFSVDCTEGSLLLDKSGLLVAFGTQNGGAIPMSEAVALAGELIFYGELESPSSFGMEVSQLDQAQCSYWELPGGVVISRIAPRGNADRAGLEAGDVLLSMGGHSITDMESYWAALEALHHREETQVQIYRSGELLDLEIDLSPEE